MNNKNQEKSQSRRASTARVLEFAIHPRKWTRHPRLLALIAVPALAVLVSFAAHSVDAPKAFKPIQLSSDPLYATTAGDKPSLALALSVEYPTVGAQYVRGPNDSIDDTYSNTNEYLGYYDAESCYAYNNAPTETPSTGQTVADYKRFDRTGPADQRKCGDGFSGNFLNWASSSAIDMLRLALSGGDRYIDRTDVTILQRAVIPNGDPICMWNSTNFPAKQLRSTGGSSGSAYWGAVPQAMVTAAGGSDIWVGNALDRIYFGTTRGGSCGDKSSYKLGGSAPVSANSTPVRQNGSTSIWWYVLRQ